MLSYHIEQLRLSNEDRWYVTQYDPETTQIRETTKVIGGTFIETCSAVARTVLNMERNYVGKEAGRKETQAGAADPTRVAPAGQ